MPAKSKWNHEKIKQESKKYKSRSDFWANSKKAYSAACRLKILDEVCSHMPLNKCQKWDYETIKKEALRFSIIECILFIMKYCFFRNHIMTISKFIWN